MNLFGYEKTETEMYLDAIHQPFKQKVDAAVGLLQLMGDGAVVCFSGGKDSIVIKDLARRAGITHQTIYSVTTIDPPELIYFIRDFHRDVIWNRQPKHMLQYMVDSGHGLPTRLARWCCEIYKENTGNDHLKIIGVRAEESLRRRKLWKQVNANRRGGTILAPIVYWTDADVWQYIHENHLPYCRLYDEGFTRIGCIGCPLAGANIQKRTFDRYPKFKEMWWRYTVKFWKRWHGIPTRDGRRRFFEDFGTLEAYFAWWLSGKAKEKNEQTEACALDLFGELPCDDDCQNRFMTI
jgi:phosphoadenosine phosphosulfate reductase